MIRSRCRPCKDVMGELLVSDWPPGAVQKFMEKGSRRIQHGVERGDAASGDIGENPTWRGWRSRHGRGGDQRLIGRLAHRDVAQSERRSRRRAGGLRPQLGDAAIGRVISKGAASPPRAAGQAAGERLLDAMRVAGAVIGEMGEQLAAAAPAQETRGQRRSWRRPGSRRSDGGRDRRPRHSAMALRVVVCRRERRWLSRRERRSGEHRRRTARR